MIEKLRKVENTPEKMSRIGAMLKSFEGRRYYPANDHAFTVTCEAIADIVYDKPNGYLWDRKNEDGTPKIEPNIGHIDNDLDWLCKRAISTFTFCPTPRHLRALYCQFLIPADGQSIAIDLEDL